MLYLEPQSFIKDMPKIILTTKIKAPVDRVFDLARSIDLHIISTIGTNEKAVAGKTSGLIELGETVTWRAKHLGVYQKLTVEITQFARPHMFEDVMLKGAFKRMRHVHTFEQDQSGTIMKDAFEFESPLGWLGRLADSIFLKRYMTKFLENKNRELKLVAEGERWKKILNKPNADEY